MMKAVGIKKIYYSIDGGVVCERVNHMVSINASNIARCMEAKFYRAPVDFNEYFKKLITRNIPSELRLENIKYFIEHNFVLTLPDWTFKITKDKFVIYDNNNIISCIVNII